MPAGGGKAKTASEAFGDLLSLLTGQPAGRQAKGQRHGAAAPASAEPPPVPFGAVPASGAPQPQATATAGARSAAADAAAPAAADPHTDDDKALADNLTWLLTLAAAPKPEPTQPIVPPSADLGKAAKDAASTSSGQTAPANSGVALGASNLPQAAAANGDHAAAICDPADLPGVQAPAASPTALPAATAKDVSASQITRAVDVSKAPVAAPANAAVASTPALADALQQGRAAAPPDGTLAAAPAIAPVSVPSAAAAAAQSKTNVAAIGSAPAPVAVPLAQADPRSGDGSSAKRDGRSRDERRIEPSPLTASTAAAAPALAVQTAADIRLQTPAAAPAVATTAATPARVEIPADADVPRQIVQAIRMQWADGVGDAKIKLQPEYLGELSISIRVEHGAVTASLESNSPSVREFIDSNQPMLRQALAEHGLNLDKLNVTEEQPQPDWSGNEDPKQRQQEEQARQAQRARRRASDDDTPAFEMVA